jgi:hypothetical protein
MPSTTSNFLNPSATIKKSTPWKVLWVNICCAT